MELDANGDCKEAGPPKRAATDEKRSASHAEGAEEAARNSEGPVRQKKPRRTEIKVAPIWKSTRDWIRKTVNKNQSHEIWNKTKLGNAEGVFQRLAKERVDLD